MAAQSVVRTAMAAAEPNAAEVELAALTATLGFTYASVEGGAVVEGVSVGALQASLVTGDVVTKVDEADIKSGDDLKAVEGKCQAGDVLKVLLTRGLDGRQDLVALEVGSSTLGLQQIRELRLQTHLPINDAPLDTKTTAANALKNMQPLAGFRPVVLVRGLVPRMMSLTGSPASIRGAHGH